MLESEAERNPTRSLKHLASAMKMLNMKGRTPEVGENGAESDENGAGLPENGTGSGKIRVESGGNGVKGGEKGAGSKKKGQKDRVEVVDERKGVEKAKKGQEIEIEEAGNVAPFYHASAMQAKAPGYPAQDITPAKKIEDPELADYVKSLEATADDRLRVLLDTHSNQIETKQDKGTNGSKKGTKKKAAAAATGQEKPLGKKKKAKKSEKVTEL